MDTLKTKVCCWCGSRVRLQACTDNTRLWECVDQLWYRCLVREAALMAAVRADFQSLDDPLSEPLEPSEPPEAPPLPPAPPLP